MQAYYRAHQPLTIFILGSVAVHAAVLAVLPPLSDIPPVPVVALSLDVTLRSPQAMPEAPIPHVAREPLRHVRGIRKARPAPVVTKPREQPVAAPADTPRAETIARAEVDSKPVVAQGEPKAATVTLAPAGGMDARSVARTGQKDTIAAVKPAETLVPPTYHAAYLRNPAPRYPLAARLNGEQGTVMLKVLVTQQGLPGSVTVEKTSGFPLLDAAAVQTVRQWRFVPARRGAQAIDASVLVPIRFRLQDAS